MTSKGPPSPPAPVTSRPHAQRPARADGEDGQGPVRQAAAGEEGRRAVALGEKSQHVAEGVSGERVESDSPQPPFISSSRALMRRHARMPGKFLDGGMVVETREGLEFGRWR